MSDADTTQNPPADIYTVKRLLALKPGEAFMYYRGNLTADVANSRGVNAYAQMLAEVQATVFSLQAAGRVAISERQAAVRGEDGQRVPVIEYRAIGIAPRGDEDCSGAEPEEAAAA
jgi:hypothetical protein